MIDKQTYKYSWIYLDYNSDSLIRILWAHYNLRYFYTGMMFNNNQVVNLFNFMYSITNCCFLSRVISSKKI
jgi:hypothetical protein